MTRRLFLTAGIGALLAGTTAYTSLVEPARLKVARWAPRPAAWPDTLPLRIAVVSDVHIAPPFMSLDRVDRIVAQVNGLAPDIVVLLGDYARGHDWGDQVAPEDAARALSGLEAPLGRWAVFGNHDWDADRSARRERRLTSWHAAFSRAGIEVLSNRASRIETPRGAFWIAGLESALAWKGLQDLPGTLAQVATEDPVLLLAHEPDIFPQVPDRVALTLAGHTHGGQVRLLGRAPVVPSAFGERYAYGHVIEKERHLIVSGGLGCSRLPVRLGMPPEIGLIELGGFGAGAAGPRSLS